MLRVTSEAQLPQPVHPSSLYTFSLSPVDCAVYGLLGENKPCVRGQDSVKPSLTKYKLDQSDFGKGKSGQRLNSPHHSQARLVMAARSHLHIYPICLHSPTTCEGGIQAHCN